MKSSRRAARFDSRANEEIMIKRTPMLDQYLTQKERYPDALLFFRMGDFYEMFFEDALTASKALEIALTSRDKKKEGAVPMCGVPYHAAQNYIQRLLDKGFKVAICEQIEDPAKATKIVRRAVTRVITPGVVLNPDALDAKESVYLAAVCRHENFGVAFAEFTTGEFAAFETPDEAGLVAELGRLAPSEILVPETSGIIVPEDVPGHRTVLPDLAFDSHKSLETIRDHFGIASLEGLGLAGHPAAARATGALIHYLKDAQGDTESTDENEMADGAFRILGSHLTHLKNFRFITLSDTMVIDAATRANLELAETLRDRKKAGSLFGVLDLTVTSAGGRMLKRWILYPLTAPTAIARRLDAVGAFVAESRTRKALRCLLEEVHDLERLSSKVAGGNLSPRDLLALAGSLDAVPRVKETIGAISAEAIAEAQSSLDPLPDLVERIRRAIREDAPVTLREGGIFRPGYHAERDELEKLARNSKTIIASIESRERKRTGISNLKVGFNKVFGYYIEVTNSNLGSAPPDFIRKQTLVGAERFVTPELKELEEKILTAEERMQEIEYRLFQELRATVSERLGEIKRNASLLAELDVYAALAEAAAKYQYNRPVVNDGAIIEIVAGRHAVIERMNLGERFVPNDIRLDPETDQVLIITGPNMAGKSTVMRQVALIVLLAQMGSFVPAAEARIGVVDRIFTRVGASDILHRGQSTFMVEMTETANILRQATSKSLVLLDEIGRGTSTFDGLSIAWAVAERLHDSIGAKTLFATHYHELTDLTLTKERVQNVHIAVKEWEGRIIFLRKIVRGGVSRSYGIQVARLAGIPQDVVTRAQEILANLESGELEAGAPRLAKPSRRQTPQMTFFEAPNTDPVLENIAEELKNIPLDTLTPIEALNILAKLQKSVLERK